MTRSSDPRTSVVVPGVELREDDIVGPKCWRKIVFHWGPVSEVLSVLVIVLFLWSIGMSVLPQYTQPDSALMRMIFMFVGAKLVGIVVALLGIPDLLGMMFWGVLFRNIGIGEFEGFAAAESFLRDIALVNIMLLAGMGLDLKELKKLVGIITKLTCIPTIAEVAVIAVVSHFLMKLPWLWAVLLGLVITAVSPNVVISILLELKQKRLGMNKGIHTVIIGMTGCNDVLSIFVFGVILGTIFSTGTLSETILQGPIGIVVGLVYGGLIGYMILYLPSDKAVYANILKFCLTFVAGLVSVLGSKYLGFPSAGALGCMTLAFILGNGWKDCPQIKVGTYLDVLWKFIKPISFALIGKELDFSVIDSNTLWQGVVVLLLGVAVRTLFGYLSTSGAEFSWRERAYITLSSLPKATVQATIGPIALDLARQRGVAEEISWANTILVSSVIAIVLTAPLGALLMEKMAPRWLQKEDEAEEQGQTNQAFV